MIIVGLTGGIGSGKSTVAKVFETLNIPVFYSDDVAKKAYLDNDIRRAIIEKFGADVLTENGVNKEKMRELIFSQPEALLFINQLIHPWVAEEFKKFIASNKSAPYVIKEAAIIIESGGYKDCDKIILITAPENQRIARVSLRDNISDEKVRERIALQMPDTEKMKYADYTWKNDNRESLLKQILLFDNMIKG
ncbi:MAG: dephospho-CoA kinase [Flavobacteriales bacterium]